MKILYSFLFTALTLSFSAQIEGSWSLNPQSGALGVGPDSASTSWWSSDANAVTDRACLFDDSIVFNSNGTFDHYMDGSTWLETWQAGSPAEGCGVPIAPHDGGSNTYTYANGMLTVNGSGAHIGLAKVHNGGEDGMPVNDEITYHVSFSGANSDIMTVDISFPNAGGTNGLGWWRYVYLKNGAAPPPPPPSFNVTFHVEVPSSVTVATSIYAGGGVLGDAMAVELADTDGDGIWCGSADVDAAGGNFTFINSPADGNDWGAKEDLTGLPCADAANWNDRIMPPITADTSLGLTFGTCDLITIPAAGCTGSSTSIISDVSNDLVIYPNPTNDVLNINSTKTVNTINIYNMIGNLVKVENVSGNNTVISVNSLKNGVYFMELQFNDGSLQNSKIVKK